MTVDRVVAGVADASAAAARARRPRLALLTAGFLLAYVAAVGTARLTVVPGTHLTVFSPAAGVAAVWFALVRPPAWRVAGGVAMVGAILAVLSATEASATDVVGFASAAVVQAAVFTWLNERRAAARSPVELAGRLHVEDLARLAGCAAAAALVTGGLGPVSLVDAGERDLTLLAAWVVRNTVTVVAIYPFSLLLLRHLSRLRDARRAGHDRLRSWPSWTPTRWVEAGVLLGATGVAFWLVFGGEELPVTFLILATSAWVGSRFTPLVANAHAIGVGGAFAGLTLQGRGPLASIEDAVLETTVVQAFVAITLAISMSLALHRRANERLTAELAAAEREARGQSEMLQAILAASEESVVVLDRAGNVVMRNRAAVRLGGGDPDQGLPTSEVDLRRPGGPRLADDELPQARAFAGEPVVAEDYVLRTRYHPDPVVVQLSAVTVRAGDGEPLAVLLSQDVTAVRREREELAAFAGVVAHDLLNPLTAVDGWSDALEDELDEDAPDVEALRGHLTRIRRGTERMHALIRDLLAYTTSRNAELHLQRVDLEALVGDVVAERLEAGRANGVEPRFTLEPLPEVLAEPVLVRQAIDNIVGNALKYVAPGVVPHLHVRARRVTGQRAPHADLVEIEIVDNGIGIPADQRGAVFDTFHRVHRDGYKGTGLGLAIVKRIAERHGGGVRADENPDGPGTSIRMTLPAVP